MHKFLIYGHGGSYNHGAEAIVKTTINLIRRKYTNSYVILSTHYPEQDRQFDIDADEMIHPDTDAWAREKAATDKSEREALAKEMYSQALSKITSDTVLLSVGGDNYCYPNWHRWAVFQQQAVCKGARSILWGCSVEPSAITPEMMDVLNSHKLILAREAKTYYGLQNLGIRADIRMIPDPAFLLKPDPIELPEGFQAENIIGINIGPLALRREAVPGILMKNMCSLIDYILSETNMKIALIPHVVMNEDNDHKVLSELEQMLPDIHRRRVWLVGETLSASEYKSVISKCSLLVCARTHASIASYSSCVPTMVLGYSVKSVGIAEDLGMNRFLLDISEIKHPDCVKDMFRLLYAEEGSIRSALGKKISSYIEQANGYIEYI